MYSIWLLPKNDDSEQLKDIMDALANKYDGPKFSPHITAFGDIEADPKIIEKIVKQSIKDIKQFKVQKSTIEFSEYVFKAAYIDLKMNTSLQTINERLDNALSSYAHYVFKPHLSLLYRVLDDSQRKNILNNMKIKDEFMIDRISVVSIRKKVEDWKTVAGPFGLGMTDG
jgi:2'-5' RNA ligase